VIIMGKSVFMVPFRNNREERAAARRIRSELGNGLGLDGPFTDRDGAVAKIAEHVRENANRAYPGDMVFSTVAALMPQDRLPDGCPCEKRSRLGIPFIKGREPKNGWQDYPENAGEVASATAVKFKKGSARRTSAIEHTVLGVSVLRRLGIESYFCLFDLEQQMVMTHMGIAMLGVSVPMIAMPKNEGIEYTTVFPAKFGAQALANLASMEALDEGATLAYVKMHTVSRQTGTIKHDIKDGRLEFGDVRAMEAGHTIFETSSLWSIEEARAEIERAKGALGERRIDGQVSMRERMERGIMHMYKCPSCSVSTAANEMLGELFMVDPENLLDPETHGRDSPTVAEMIAAVESVSQNPGVPKFREYVETIDLARGHLHSVSGCSARPAAKG
jgi:hypothetical protein